ncbi:DNA glycosylase [Leifsonia xyli subsp. cynodontis DSM 46306]|jgi:endonuclease-8|uniref:DNA-(apurinic or apyrimidinic site) lyase n=1 Tax=Leifsonia xyli subsp. cynodontis DSM 46306 TaxID=1389489 RepID=U3P549_LEIXC|nr:DNA-formamidopyrimidine glycosylase family protein [Leifsonia xyli]AGW40594.1 DNA glycosylase [Leifsonia xyli subsp. cynodontis DSM 46306]
MPEGDTVYQAADRLRRALAGRVLTATDFRVPAYATVDLSGQRVDNVVSRGKHLLIRVGGHSIHSHLRMDGSWEVYPPDGRWRHPAHQARVVLRTKEGEAVGFLLGTLDLLPREREDEAVGHLGPDLLDPGWDASSAAEAVRRLRERLGTPVAVALLDERVLAGIGNVYANELCFLRGMLPTRPVREADIPAAVDLAHRLLTANRDRSVRVTTGDTRRGRTVWVYGRQGQPCRRCGTPIRRGRLGYTELTERVTYFCPVCQS